MSEENNLITTGNELALIEHKYLVKEGQFELVGFDELYQQVEQLGDYLSEIEVTPENIKVNKKLVASIRKTCDGLNRERIDFKKEYMKPVERLEQQVKLITSLASEYENLVRDQIRELEEKERREKSEEIKELFSKRLRAYGSETLYSFDDFIQPKYLNKSMSMNKVEKEMVDWLEMRRNDISSLEVYASEHHSDFSNVFDYYRNCNDLGKTMSHFNELEKERTRLMSDLDSRPQRKHKVQKYVLIKIKEEDTDTATTLLDAKGIGYELL